VLPRVMFDDEGVRTIDDLTVEDLRRGFGRPVALVDSIRELADVLAQDAPALYAVGEGMAG